MEFFVKLQYDTMCGALGIKDFKVKYDVTFQEKKYYRLEVGLKIKKQVIIK